MRGLMVSMAVILLGILPADFSARLKSNEAPSAAPLHPWWQMTSAQMETYFQEGRAASSKGLGLEKFIFVARPVSGPVSLGASEEEVVFDRANLLAPPLVFRLAGYLAESKKETQPQAAARLRDVAVFSEKYLVFLASLEIPGGKERLERVEFLLGNNLDRREISPEPPSATLKQKPATGKTGWVADYVIWFPLSRPEVKATLSPRTKWLRLWIISGDKRLPVTFWLDDSKRTEIGKVE